MKKLYKNFGILLAICLIFVFASVVTAQTWTEETYPWENVRPQDEILGASVTTLTSGMTGAASMAIINTNFSNLNTENAGKFDIVDWYATTTIGLLAYDFPTADGTVSQVLVTDGSGTLSWADQTGSGGSGGIFSTTTLLNYYNGGLPIVVGHTATSSRDAAFEVNGNLYTDYASGTAATFNTLFGNATGLTIDGATWGDLLYWNGTAWDDVATSSLGLEAAGLSEWIDYGNWLQTGDAGEGIVVSGSSTIMSLTVEYATTTEKLVVGDSSAGDSRISLYAGPRYVWTLGLDDSDSDVFKIATSTDFSSQNIFSIATTTGAITIGGYTLPVDDGTADYILKTDGSGAVTWQVDVGQGEETDPIWLAASASYLSLTTWYATTTDALTEGSNNLYYTDARVNTLINASSTMISFPCANGYMLAYSTVTSSWGCVVPPAGGGSGGGSLWATTSDALIIYPADLTDTVVIGSSATTTANAILEIYGGVLIDDGVDATSTLQLGDTSNPACEKFMGMDGDWHYKSYVGEVMYISTTSDCSL